MAPAIIAHFPFKSTDNNTLLGMDMYLSNDNNKATNQYCCEWGSRFDDDEQQRGQIKLYLDINVSQ